MVLTVDSMIPHNPHHSGICI